MRVIRSPYDDLYKPVQVDTGQESRVKQAFKDASSVDYILRRYAQGGVMVGNEKEPRYVDVSNVGSYQQALDRLRSVEDLVSRLPEAAQAAYAESPRGFLEAISKLELSRAEAEAIGLVEPLPAVDEPVPADPPVA